MTPKDRILAAIRGEPVDRVPVTCVNQTATVEQMDAIGVGWPDAHLDGRKMAKLASAAFKLTRLETARVPYCQTVEAEALGCQVRMGGKDQIPSVYTSPYETATEFSVPKSFTERDRIPAVLKAVSILKNQVKDELPVMAGVVGPFSLAGILSGLSSFLSSLIINPERVRRFVETSTEVVSTYGRALIDAGADIIVIEDMLASADMISPKMFHEYARNPLRSVIKDLNHITVLHICGNANPIVEDMAETGANALSIDSRTKVESAKRVAKGVAIIGNIDPVRVLQRGARRDVEAACAQALEESVDLLAPGCSLSPYTPSANLNTMIRSVATRA